MTTLTPPQTAAADGAVPREIANPEVKTHSVTSRDGTTIGYFEVGSGPAVVIYHGTMVSARNFTQLANALAGTHTVDVPDRRGRGLSGPFGEDFSIAKDVEDLEAVLERTGAHDIFAVSAGALVALQAALRNPGIRRLALYEPALSVNGSLEPSLDRLDREIAEGNTAGALVTGMLETDLGPPIFKVMPRALLEAMTNSTMKSEEKKARPGDVTMRMLAPTQHYDLELVREMSGTLESYRAVQAQVLLMGGTKSPAWTKVALDALEQVLPNVTCVTLPGLDHGGATNPGAIARASDPQAVGRELVRFFA